MKRFSILALAAVVAGAGCTTNSLERHTLNQIRTSGDYRYQQVVNCLAVIKAKPDTLPSFALLADGVTRIEDTETVNAITTLTHAAGGFGMQNLGVALKRSPEGQWTLDPIVDYERLEAIRCVCRWVVFGPEEACRDCPGLLTDPAHDFSPGPHFGVAGRMARLPVGWLQVGGKHDVPKCACYKSHCCDTWVWVTPEGMQGLAEFTLVLHDIATIDVTSMYPTPPLVTLTRYEFTEIDDPITSGQGKDKDTGKKAVLAYQVTRAVRPEYKTLIEQKIQTAMKEKDEECEDPEKEQAKTKVAISWEEWMRYTTPYHGSRVNVSPQGGGAPKARTSPGNPEPSSNAPPGQGIDPKVTVAPAEVKIEPDGEAKIRVCITSPADMNYQVYIDWPPDADVITRGKAPIIQKGKKNVVVTLHAGKKAKSIESVKVRVFTAPMKMGEMLPGQFKLTVKEGTK